MIQPETPTERTENKESTTPREYDIMNVIKAICKRSRELTRSIEDIGKCLSQKAIRPHKIYILFTEDMQRIEHSLAAYPIGSTDAADLIAAAGYAASRGRSVEEMIKQISIKEN